MSHSPRFGGIVRLPPLQRRAMRLAIATAAPFALAIMALFFWVFSGARWMSVLQWPRQVWWLIAVGYVLFLAGAALGVRRLVKKLVLADLHAWASVGERTEADLAVGRFYTSLFRMGKAGRAAAVSSLLSAVAADACRTVVIGDLEAAPADDGSLHEECDAFEGRARASLRWMYLLLTVPFVFQVVLAFSINGVNLLAWTWPKLLMLLPAIFNLLLIAFVSGLVKPLGVVAIGSPRRLQYSTARGTKVFTPDDSVLLIAGTQQQLVATFYRNDGSVAAIRYSSVKTPGFQQMLSRWCVVGSRAPEAPAATDQMPLPVA